MAGIFVVAPFYNERRIPVFGHDRTTLTRRGDIRRLARRPASAAPAETLPPKGFHNLYSGPPDWPHDMCGCGRRQPRGLQASSASGWPGNTFVSDGA